MRLQGLMVRTPISSGFIPLVGRLVGEGQVQTEAAIRTQYEREKSNEPQHEYNPGKSQEKVLQRKRIITSWKNWSAKSHGGMWALQCASWNTRHRAAPEPWAQPLEWNMQISRNGFPHKPCYYVGVFSIPIYLWIFCLCFAFFLIKRIINADDLKTNCQMKRLQSGTSGFADMIQLSSSFLS